MVAVIYIALTIIIQLNIIATRNPSVWWYFSKKTAPPPSWKLAVPVALFLVASTFIAGGAHPLPSQGLAVGQLLWTGKLTEDAWLAQCTGLSRCSPTEAKA